MEDGLLYFLFCFCMRMSEYITSKGGLRPVVSRAMMLRECQFVTKVTVFVFVPH